MGIVTSDPSVDLSSCLGCFLWSFSRELSARIYCCHLHWRTHGLSYWCGENPWWLGLTLVFSDIAEVWVSGSICFANPCIRAVLWSFSELFSGSLALSQQLVSQPSCQSNPVAFFWTFNSADLIFLSSTCRVSWTDLTPPRIVTQAVSMPKHRWYHSHNTVAAVKAQGLLFQLIFQISKHETRCMASAAFGSFFTLSETSIVIPSLLSPPTPPTPISYLFT